MGYDWDVDTSHCPDIARAADLFFDAGMMDEFDALYCYVWSTSPEHKDTESWALYRMAANTGAIPRGAAALGALFYHLCPPDVPADVILRGGLKFKKEDEPNTEADGGNLVIVDASDSPDVLETIEIPYWAAIELFKALHLYLRGDRESLNAAFGIAGGKDGRNTVNRPMMDRKMQREFAHFRAHRVLNGGSGEYKSAKAAFEEYHRLNSENDSPNGYSVSTVDRKLTRLEEMGIAANDYIEMMNYRKKMKSQS